MMQNEYLYHSKKGYIIHVADANELGYTASFGIVYEVCPSCVIASSFFKFTLAACPFKLPLFLLLRDSLAPIVI